MDKRTPIQTWLYLAGALILIVGLITAALVYRSASEDMGDIDGYEIIDGVAYPVMLPDSKRYRHDLELFGGKAAVMADDFSRWFSGLWKGKRLALTLTVLSIGISLLCFRAARRLSAGNRKEE